MSDAGVVFVVTVVAYLAGFASCCLWVFWLTRLRRWL